jgi:2-keto-3-deoxy-L-fuconate dehydrogenase
LETGLQISDKKGCLVTIIKIGTDRLARRIALVTAAGQGIGRAIAERLTAEGAAVHVCDLNPDTMKDTPFASASVVDACDAKAVARWMAPFGQIDILVHAVGHVHQGSIEETSAQDWRRSMAITLDSAYVVIGAAVPKMKAKGGSVITISSVASSIKGFPRRAAYGAAKGGVIGLTKACAADYLISGIRFNAVCPGTVDSPSLRGRITELAQSLGSLEAAEQAFISRQPSGRLGTPEDIAGVCAFLASDDGRFVTGQAINIDGGITI